MHKRNILLSIITCTYNSEKFLSETISSVEKQGLDPKIFEHIFIDAESSDETLQIIHDYMERNPSYNIRIVSREAKGIYNAINK